MFFTVVCSAKKWVITDSLVLRQWAVKQTNTGRGLLGSTWLNDPKMSGNSSKEFMPVTASFLHWKMMQQNYTSAFARWRVQLRRTLVQQYLGVPFIASYVEYLYMYLLMTISYCCIIHVHVSTTYMSEPINTSNR
jgi:hypothetical protein